MERNAYSQRSPSTPLTFPTLSLNQGVAAVPYSPPTRQVQVTCLCYIPCGNSFSHQVQ